MSHARRLVALVLVLAIVPTQARADMIVFKNGKVLRGAVANRDRLAAEARTIESIGILPDSLAGGEALVRVDRAEVDHVILEDGETRRVFDMSGQRPGATPAPASPVPARYRYRGISTPMPPAAKSGSNQEAGAVLAVLGIAALAIGAAVKMGGPEVTFHSSGVRAEEHTYNATNYVLMGGGGVLAAVGIVLLSTPSRTSVALAGPGVGRGPGAARLAVSYRF